MTPLLKKILIGMAILLLFVEIGSRYIQYEKQAEKERPIDDDGKLKDGFAISFKEEEQMAINSFPTVKEKEYAESMLYGFAQCLMSAETLGDNAYICLANNVTNSALNLEEPNISEVEKGKLVLKHLSNEARITGVQVMPLDENVGKYQLSISYDREAAQQKMIVVIEDREIQSFQSLN